jgi:ABC-type lipoprotein export system ATPase subunit
MIEIKDLCKSFPGRGVVLDNLTLGIAKKETVAITGPSGSGKTTLLNMLGLLDKPDSGSISFEGKEILGFNDNEAAGYRSSKIGFVFQNHLLMPHLTVYENVVLPLAVVKLPDNELKSRIENINELIKLTGLSSLTGRFPSEISGGESQRAALVRALANNPQLLLADEPTGLLDEKNSEILTDLLVKLNETKGIIIVTVTHSAAVAAKMKRHLRFSSGKLVD